MCQAPEGDKQLPNGKILTKQQQIDNTERTILHIGRRFLGNGWTIPEVDSFEELVNELISLTKDKWATTSLNAKFEFNNKGYASLSKYVPFIELPNENRLKVSEKDKAALRDKFSTIPDTEESDNSSDIAF